MLLHDTAHGANDWLDGWHIETVLVAAAGMIVFILVALSADTDAVLAGGTAFIALSPLWLPVSLFVIFWKTWMHYIRYAFWFNTPMTLLHIELPAEITKSPLAMELFLAGVWNYGGETTFIQRIWKGQYRGIVTLELVSNEGRIGFYIHVRKTWKETLEARLYGQFPEAKITEVVKDYVDEVPYSPETYDLWCTEYEKADAEALPIKTYLDYSLDKDTDTPEVTVDPLTNIFEFLSTIKPDEYLWIQIVMKARKKDEWYGFYTGDHWKDDAKKKIKEITEEAIKRSQAFIKSPESQERAAERAGTLMNKGERDKVELIEHSLSKQVFDCGFRGMYIVKKTAKFDLTRINNLVVLWNPFRSETSNRLNVTRGKSIFDYPWQDWNGIRSTMISKKMFFWYKHRAYFYIPYDQKPVCMTTEELASIWHFPDSSVKTPALQRVPSRRAPAPSNLPV